LESATINFSYFSTLQTDACFGQMKAKIIRSAQFPRDIFSGSCYFQTGFPHILGSW